MPSLSYQLYGGSRSTYGSKKQPLGGRAEDYGTYGGWSPPKKDPLGGGAADYGDTSAGTSKTVPNTTGSWSNTQTPGYSDALNKRLGEDVMDRNWANPPAPAPEPRNETGGGFTLPNPPIPTVPTTIGTPESTRPTTRWGRYTPPKTLAPVTNPVNAAPIIDLPTPAAPSAAPETAAKVAPGPGGFVESFTPGTMPSVDQLYKTYEEVFGNQGGMDYLNSPQFQSIWESGNVPWWMLSDPRWRNYLVKAGLLNWDAIRKRLGE